MSYTPSLVSVGIEINYACNRTCFFCPNSQFPRKEQIFLADELFYKIIDNLVDIDYTGNIFFNQYNEPLLDKRLPQFLLYVKEQLPECFTYINTNGDALDLKLWNALRESGLGYANISQYDGYITDKITHTGNNVKDEDKWRFVVNLFDDNTKLDNRAGLVDLPNAVQLPLKETCPRPFMQMIINYEGNVVLCCDDYHNKIVAGSIKNERIEDIWKGEVFSRHRKLLGQGNRGQLEICKLCSRGKDGFPPNYKANEPQK